MTTLITHKTRSGGLRRCDARCYNAKRLECECVCGGLNHGVGEIQAIRRTKRLLADLIAADGVDVPILTPEERQNPRAGLGAYPLFKTA